MYSTVEGGYVTEAGEVVGNAGQPVTKSNVQFGEGGVAGIKGEYPFQAVTVEGDSGVTVERGLNTLVYKAGSSKGYSGSGGYPSVSGTVVAG